MPDQLGRYPDVARRRMMLLIPFALILLISSLLWQAAELQQRTATRRAQGLQAAALRESTMLAAEQREQLNARIRQLPSRGPDQVQRVIQQLANARSGHLTQLQYDEQAAEVPAPLQALALEILGDYADMPELLDFLDKLLRQQPATRVDACHVWPGQDRRVLSARCVVRWLFREDD